MNPEIAQLKGELQNAKHRFDEFDVEAKGLIMVIRMNTNPHEPDVTKLKTDVALMAMERLNKVRSEMLGLKAQITEMESNFK